MSKIKKVRIAHIVPSFDVGGLENGIVNLINYMDRDCFVHYLIVLSGDAVSSERILCDVDILLLNKRDGNDIGIPKQIARYLKKNKIVLIRSYAWGTWIESIVAAKLAGIHTHIHSEHGFIVSDKYRMPLRQRIAQNIASRFTNKIITVSDYIRDGLLKYSYISSDKITTLINGVDTTCFCPKYSQSTLKNELNISENCVLVGMVSRLDLIKDIGTAIRAMQLLENHHLVIVGRGDQKHHLEKQRDQYGLHNRVHFLGERNDINYVLQSLDIFLLTSLLEGTSNTLLEAMSSALPVIATNVGGNKLIVKDRMNGFLVEVRDTKKIATLLDDFTINRNTFLKIGRQARKDILEKYSLEVMVKNYEHLYLNILGMEC